MDIELKLKNLLLETLSTATKSVSDRTKDFKSIEKSVVDGFMAAAAEAIGHCLSL